MIRRPARPEDLDDACALVGTMRPVYEAAIGAWDAGAVRDAVAANLARWEMLEVDGRVIGGLCVVDEADAVWLHQILLASQGSGLGTTLIREVLDDAHARGRSVRLRMIPGNPAQRLYERLGFVVERVADRVYMVAHPRQ
jgi:ribosomal protein S18 acetylase RimI-like enzyme